MIHTRPIRFSKPLQVLAATSCTLQVLAGCGGGSSGPVSPTPTPVATPVPTNGANVVFQSDRDGDFEILQLNADGSVRRLTDNAVPDIEPAPSNDNRRIAFASSRAGNLEIFVAGPNNTLRLTNNRFEDDQPTFSPDNRRIAWKSTRNGNSDLYIANADGTPNADGTRETRLTTGLSFDSDPTFGEDNRIYFISDRNGSLQVFSMLPNGTEVRQITRSNGNCFRPTLSSDGRRLVYAGDEDGDLELFAQNLSAGQPLGAPVQLTRNTQTDTDAAFSRDNRTLFFASDRNGNFDIYRANADGTNVQVLAANAAIDRVPRAR